MGIKINYCPLCGERLFEEERNYLIEVQFAGQRSEDKIQMLVFVDENALYEINAGDHICFSVKAGFHVLKFRHKIRSKTITLLVTSSYVIKVQHNSISGLIETSVNVVGNSSAGISQEDIARSSLTEPVMVSEDGRRIFEMMLGNDDPEFEIQVTSGLNNGVLRIFYNRCEFSFEEQNRKDITFFKDIVSARKKMGAIDLQCEGNVHKVYSIPKDIYNEVIAFLNNRIAEIQDES